MTDSTPHDEQTAPAGPVPPEGPAAPDANPLKAKRRAGLGTWALVLGIVGILFAVIPHTSGFGIFLAILALILGGVGLLRKGGRAPIGTILGGVALILGIIFVNVYGGGSSNSLATTSDSSQSAGSPAKAASPTKPAAPAKPVVPAGTVSQLQALSAAKGYLSDGQGFSEAGLLGQLHSSYGNGFAKADAQWAIDHSAADWNAQAVIAAKGYLSDGQGFSQAGLVGQLDSSSGNQFTKAQAKYGEEHAGADWNAQAVTAAKGYLSDGEGFSRKTLIEQLYSPYGNQFTVAEATYAANQVGLK